MSTDLPSPYDYLDHRRFLADWFKAKKEANPRFSHRLFARLAGQKSSALLNNVISGRRNLSPAAMESFIEAMSLRRGEASFFRLLVQLDAAPDTEARNEVWEAIAATRRFREARKVDRGAFEYLSNWMLPAIRELAARPDFRDDPTWVAGMLRPRVTPAEARSALDTLKTLGMLVEDDEGNIVPAEVSVATPPEVAGLAVANYHRGMIELARESIERFESDERHLVAVTVGVPASLLPRLKAEANAFTEKLMHLCDAADHDADRVMQFNLQLFPLTAKREETP